MPIKTIADLIQDPKNANKGTQRGTGFLEDSLRKYGAGRSILVDRNGVIIAGNKTYEQAGALGIEDVVIVQTDGTKLVAVQRTDLDIKDKNTRELAIADNRVGEVNLEWDSAILAELAGEGVNLDDLWNDNELALVTGNIPDPDDPNEHWNGMPEICNDPRACRQLSVYFEKPENVEAFADVTNTKITDKTKSIWYPKAPE